MPQYTIRQDRYFKGQYPVVQAVMYMGGYARAIIDDDKGDNEHDPADRLMADIINCTHYNMLWNECKWARDIW